MARSVQKQVRLTPEEAAEYDRIKSRGLTADRAMYKVLGQRFGLRPERFEPPPAVVLQPPVDAVSRIRVPAPQKRFKPDFKGKN